MILQDKFYTITSLNHENGLIEAIINIDANHEIFKGHFPGNPVTPGVVQMEIIKELLSTHLKRTVHLKTLSTCKFLAILNPNETPNVNVKISILPNETDSIKISGQILADSTTFFKLQAEYN